MIGQDVVETDTLPVSYEQVPTDHRALDVDLLSLTPDHTA